MRPAGVPCREHCTGVGPIFLARENRLWVGATNGLYKQNLTSPSYGAYDLAAVWPTWSTMRCGLLPGRATACS